MRTKLFALVSVIMVLSMVLGACATPTPQVIVQTVAPQVIVQTAAPQIIEKVSTQVVQQVVTATPVPPTAAPTKPAAKAADTIVLALQQEPDTMHPLIGSMMARTIIYQAIAPGCMGQDENTKWVPFGCETVPTVDNGGAKLVGDGADQHLEVTYKIKKGWRWTDGTPVTSADSVYYWKLYMDPDLQAADRSGIEKIYDVKVVDDSTFVWIWMSENQAKQAAAGTLTGNVNFAAFKQDYIDSGYDQQAGPVVDPTYWNYVGWLPAHVWSKIPAKQQASDPATSKMVLGDGAYQIKEWKAGQEMDLVKASQPFPLGDAKITNVVFRFFADTGAVISAVQKGEIDVVTGTGGLSPASAPDLDKIEAAGNYKVLWLPGYQWEHIDLNTTKFPLDDLKVRQALAYATDKKTLVNKLYFGKQATTDLPIPAMSWAYTDNYTKYPFDLAKAKQTLTDAGWDCKALPCTKTVKDAAGKDVKKNLEITLMTTDRADRQALAQVIQSMWKAANVGVNVQFLYGRGLFATADAGGPLSSRTFDAAIYTWISGDDATFNSLYKCQSIPSKDNNWVGQNYPGFCSKDADNLLQKSEIDPTVALSQAKRKPVIEQFFKIWTDNLPVIPLFANTTPYVYRVGLQNYKPGTTQYAGDAWNAWEWVLNK